MTECSGLRIRGNSGHRERAPGAPAAPTASVTVQPTCAVPTGTIVVTAPTGAGLTYSIDGTTYTNTTGTFTARSTRNL